MARGLQSQVKTNAKLDKQPAQQQQQRKKAAPPTAAVAAAVAASGAAGGKVRRHRPGVLARRNVMHEYRHGWQKAAIRGGPFAGVVRELVGEFTGAARGKDAALRIQRGVFSALRSLTESVITHTLRGAVENCAIYRHRTLRDVDIQVVAKELPGSVGEAARARFDRALAAAFAARRKAAAERAEQRANARREHAAARAAAERANQ